MEHFRFPLFIDLQGKKTVIVGGGKVALRRAQVLMQFGAEITLIAPQCSQVPDGATFLQRPYTPGDLEGAALAVAATDYREVNHQVFEEAQKAGIFISVCDSPEESSFFFPAVCQGGGLIAGVVSGGHEHHKTAEAAKKIRSVLEELP